MYAQTAHLRAHRQTSRTLTYRVEVTGPISGERNPGLLKSALPQGKRVAYVGREARVQKIEAMAELKTAPTMAGSCTFPRRFWSLANRSARSGPNSKK